MDNEVYEVFKSGSDLDIRSLYQFYLPAFVNYISKTFKCDKAQARDMYPEAFSIVYFNIRKGKLTPPLKSSIQTYLNSTGWNLYHRRYMDKYQRDKLPLENIETEPETKSMVDEVLMQKERSQHVHSLLEKIGEPCKNILVQIYIYESGYKDLSVAMNVPEATLRKRKFDCLAKMRKLMDELKLEL